MFVEQSLLDYMAAEIGCSYLSDLHYLSRPRRQVLAHKVEKLPLDEHDIKEWNDALTYVTDLPAAATAREAKKALVHALAK